MSLIDAALNRRRTVLSILLLLLLAGSYAYIAIPKGSNPDINIPLIYVSMHHEGISPTDAERLLIRPMEQELSTIEGVKEMKATGYLGGANVVLEFNAGFDSEQALDDVREGVDRAKPELPDETDEPVVDEVNFSLFPVIIVNLSGSVPDRTLLGIARDLQDKVESLNAVLEAPIEGEQDEQVEIVVDPLLIESYGLNGTDIISFFQRSDKLVAAGNLDTGSGRFAIKVPGLFENLRDIQSMPLKVSGDSVVTVDDIGEIKRNFKDANSYARLDGEKALAIKVVKRTGENVIETIENVKELVRAEQAFWPDGVQVTFTQDESIRIREMLTDLQNNVLSAILLVMIVCVAALGLAAAGLVGVAIPGAFLTGVLFLYSAGLTVNVVVLFALILSVGLLVDGAIVVVEYADRKMSEGLHRKDAYAEASKRMGWPIISSTATTLAAFFPLLFWPDIVGEFMKFMPLTLIAVLLSSLAMALVFVPTLGSLVGRPGAANDPEMARMLSLTEEGDLGEVKGWTGRYLKVLDKALDFPGMILVGAAGILIGVQILYAVAGSGVEFFPDIEPDKGVVLVHARGNMSISEQDHLVREVEKIVLEIGGIKSLNTNAGSTPGGRNDLGEDVIGVLNMEYADWDKRAPVDDIMDSIREKTKHIPGIFVETQKEEKGPGGGKALQLQIRSRFPALIEDTVRKLRQGLDEVGGFIDVEDSRPVPGIEWELSVDRAQASKFNLDITTIGQHVRLVTNGLKISEYRPDDSKDEIDVLIRHSIDERSLDQLDRVRVETDAGSIPITNFVTRTAKPRIGQIERSDTYRMMTISADVPPGVNVDAKVTEVKEWLKTANIDPRVQFKFKGQDEQQNKAQGFLIRAFIVALFVMAIILVTQFNSFYSALLILTSVIMSTIGVMIGLLIMGKPFGIVMGGVGVISLAGIIVNNNIVLIDTYDHLIKSGKYSVREAVMRTGAQRLRPVVLTTITTVLGLMPMVLQMNIDFLGRSVSVGAPSTQWWVDLATAVAFGLIFATPLTLIFTPCALLFKDKAGRFFQRISPFKNHSAAARNAV